jgi:hypothetical protein
MANIKDLIKSIEAADSSFDEKLAAINQMEETLVAMRQQEEQAVQENVDLIVEAIKVMERKVENQLEIAKSIVPEKGDKGDKGDRGLDGANGQDGKDGRDGINGRDGQDGQDGVSVTDAKIDFDGSLIITLSTGQEINVGEVVAPELQEKIKLVTSGGAGTVLPEQTGNANKYLKTDGTGLSWDTLNGSDIDLSSPPTIGNTTPNTGTFTTLIGGGDSANYGQLTGGATTKAVEFQTLGSDANISLVLDSKGTGAIDLVAGSSGVNISNGGTVTAVTRTAAGTGYTGTVTWTASAPTTVGGTTASGTTPITTTGTPTIVSGGTGYTVGNVLTIVGGTPSSGAGTLTVTAVSGGVITAATYTNFATYSAYAANPVSVTGGSGSGATFNMTWGIANSFVITNAGSGYVEQPTVTFSGGSGSGAAAYATVGSGTRIQSLGSTMSFYSPNGEGFRVQDGGTTSSAYWVAFGTNATPSLRATSSISGSIETASAVPIQFKTSTSLEQMRVSHTASAVNYVQVTGAATGGTPAISAQGTDAAVSLNLISKSTGVIRFYTATASSEQFRVTHTAGTIVNYATATGAITGAGPIFSVAGTDADIDLNLTPKGAGAVRFGTYTGTILTPTGYITIKDSGGTTRRLLVG